MGWFYILIIFVSLDAFILMMEKGATTYKINLKNSLYHSALFSLINTSMYFVGAILAVIILKERLIQINRMIAFVIFIFIGTRLLLKAAGKRSFVERLDDQFNMHKTCKIAFFCGIDCFLIGFGAFYLDIDFLVQIVSVFVITLLMVYIALMTGYYQGAAFQKAIYLISAFIYLTLAFIQMIIVLQVI